MVDVTVSAGTVAQLVRALHRVLRKPLPDLRVHVHTIRAGHGVVVVTNEGSGPAFNVRVSLYSPREDLPRPKFPQKCRQRGGAAFVATHLEPGDRPVERRTEPWHHWSDCDHQIGIRLDWEQYTFWGRRNRRRAAHFERPTPVGKRRVGG